MAMTSGKVRAVATAAKPPVRGRLRATDKARVAEILRRLAAMYPDAVCALHHRNAWELTIATILSAQTTDARVNLVTPELFRLFPTPKAMAEATLPALEQVIRATGFFRAKSRSIQGAARVVTEEFGGEVPQTMDELLRLPGVARKTANVVLGSWYGIAVGVVVDTHVLRLSRRLELTKQTDPVKVEVDLQRVVPATEWINYSHRIIFHGRQVCVARKPRCVDCALETICRSKDKTWSSGEQWTPDGSAVEVPPVSPMKAVVAASPKRTPGAKKRR